MSYRTALESRLAKRTAKAILDFNLIEDGDRVMVGLSGGKDSWALMQLLDLLRRRAPIDFSLVAVTVDSGYEAYRHDLIARTCEAHGWEYRIEHTGIGGGDRRPARGGRDAVLALRQAASGCAVSDGRCGRRQQDCAGTPQ